jgi:hypothetical protein
MSQTRAPRPPAWPRDRSYFACPRLWPFWPFLPVKRYPPGGPPEYGVLYDAARASGTSGYESTVFRANLHLLPETEAQLLALPRHAYASPVELAADGWMVD